MKIPNYAQPGDIAYWITMAIDWAGCRCQALALTGDAANPDPVCELAPGHAQVLQTAFEDSRDIEVHFDYRNFGGAN